MESNNINISQNLQEENIEGIKESTQKIGKLILTN